MWGWIKDSSCKFNKEFNPSGQEVFLSVKEIWGLYYRTLKISRLLINLNNIQRQGRLRQLPTHKVLARAWQSFSKPTETIYKISLILTCVIGLPAHSQWRNPSFHYRRYEDIKPHSKCNRTSGEENACISKSLCSFRNRKIQWSFRNN